MRRLRWNLLAVLAPAMIVGLVLTGCGKKDDSKTNSSDGGKPSADGAAKTSSEKTPVDMSKRGTFKGRVVLAGDPPNLSGETADLQAKMKAKDEAHCLKGASDEEKSAFEWVVDPKSKGVKNVIVWLAAPEGKFYKLEDQDKKPAQAEVKIDQPHCAFIPHCAVAFTHYSDGKKLVPTGQKVVFHNSAETAHNTNYKGVLVAGKNILLNPGQTVPGDDIKPDRKEITLSCEIHPWMRAYIRDLDHPFAAVTDKDGNFEIKNVPTGVDLMLIVWHEKAGYVTGEKGEKIQVKDGETKEIKINAK